MKNKTSRLLTRKDLDAVRGEMACLRSEMTDGFSRIIAALDYLSARLDILSRTMAPPSRFIDTRGIKS